MSTNFINMISKGLGGYAPESTPPGKLVRFPTCERRGDRSGWARLFADGEGGVYGCWRQGVSEIWQAREALSEENRREFTERVLKTREKAEKEMAWLRAECRLKSAKLLEKAKLADPKHPYFERKGVSVSHHQLYQIENTLLVPVLGPDGTLRGLQFIGPDGTKKFKMGTEIAGSYFGIGKSQNKTLLICEGWATAAALHETTGHGVAIAFTVGNLRPVCETLRAKYPDWSLIICADDDHATPGNPGLTKATEAALAVGGLLAVPDFCNTERGPKDTDFNDLSIKAGGDVVKRCIDAAAEPPIKKHSPETKNPAQGKFGSNTAPGTLLFFDEINNDALAKREGLITSLNH